tara:strand:- start:374 stop:1660 length:1287 start_codon:yes stop_codon:yes gene_type:complete
MQGGATVQAETLSEALAAAYSTNPSLIAQQYQLKAVDETVSQALSNWRPNVTLSGDIEREYTRLNTRAADRDQIRTPRNGSLVVTQPLFRGFRTINGLSRAEANVQAQRATLRGFEQGILLQAATAYTAVVRDKAVLELNKNNEEVLRRQLEATQDRFRVGEITRTDVSQAEARVSGATADRIQAEGTLQISRATYLNVIGQTPGKLTPPKPLENLPKTLEEARDIAKKGHPDIISAQFSERSAKDAVKVKRGELYPTLNAVGTVKRDWESSSNDSQITTGEVRLDLSIPLYQKGTVYSQLREAKVDAGRSRLVLENARRTVLANVSGAWETLTTTGARIKSFEAQIKASAIALEGVQREASVGSRTVLDVLDAEQELLDAKVSLVRAQRDKVVASFQLKEAIGELTAENLSLPVDLFNPEAYYKSKK